MTRVIGFLLVLSLLAAAYFKLTSVETAVKETRYESVIRLTRTNFLGVTTKKEGFLVSAIHPDGRDDTAADRATLLFEASADKSAAALKSCFEKVGFKDVRVWSPNEKNEKSDAIKFTSLSGLK